MSNRLACARAALTVIAILISLIPRVVLAQETRTCRGKEATVVGTPGPDVVAATKGRDVIVTLEGSDRISGVEDPDLVCSGAGDDSVSGTYARVFGGSGNDNVDMGDGEVHGGRGSDTLRLTGGDTFGGRGNDRVQSLRAEGGRGNDVVTGGDVAVGGPGHDTLRPMESCGPVMLPGAGDDVVTGGRGVCLGEDVSASWLDLRQAPRGMRVDLGRGRSTGWGVDKINNIGFVVATPHDDVLIGSDADDRLHGAGGDDRLIGRGGEDELISDDFYEPGTEGFGRAGSDIVRGDEGDDQLFGFEGIDRLYGGTGNDRLEGGNGADHLYGGRGDRDVVSYYGWGGAPEPATGVRVDLSIGRATGMGADALAGLESIYGTSFKDVLIGDSRPNTFQPGFGDDRVRAGAGNDLILDSIRRYWPASGDDAYNGGEGMDTVSWVHADKAITVDLALGIATGNGSERLRDIEGVVGSPNGDRLSGDDADNRLSGRGGADYLDARLGTDSIDGGESVDVCINGEELTACP